MRKTTDCVTHQHNVSKSRTITNCMINKSSSNQKKRLIAVRKACLYVDEGKTNIMNVKRDGVIEI